MDSENYFRDIRSFAIPNKDGLYCIYRDKSSDDPKVQSAKPHKCVRSIDQALVLAKELSEKGWYVEVWGDDILASAEDGTLSPPAC